MSIKNLLRMGHPLLRKVAMELSKEEILAAQTSELIHDLIENMHHYGGVGIAAPQIGIAKAVAVMEIKLDNPRYEVQNELGLLVLINPKIKVLDDEKQTFWEGCLSVPGLRGEVTRAKNIQINYLNEKAEEKELILSGFSATVFQHELDHLYGKLYVDHIKDMKKLVYQTEFETFIKPNLEQYV